MQVILQSPTTHETRSIRVACMLMDGVGVEHTTIQGLAHFKPALRDGRALPVGSVEFVRQAMQLAGITEPEPLSYPDALRPWLHRELRQVSAGSVIGEHFVKPVATKLFNGFVFNTLQDPDTLDAHDQEQYWAFMAMPAQDPVWISEPVEFLSEWRYYVIEGKIAGQARYDPLGADNAPAPDMAEVLAAIDALGESGVIHPFAIDMGVLQSGETSLVEVNDAWAVGLYGNAIEHKTYFQFLHQRWASLGPEAAAA